MASAINSVIQSDKVEQELALLGTLSLYLHIPFCHTKCHYCDFNSYAGLLNWREPYVRGLVREIEWAGDLARQSGLAGQSTDEPWPCRTIFFGGGTPSLLSAEQIARTLETARRVFAVQPDGRLADFVRLQRA